MHQSVLSASWTLDVFFVTEDAFFVTEDAFFVMEDAFFVQMDASLVIKKCILGTAQNPLFESQNVNM
jgi:hypothetical protein